jgi:predicted ribosomally synthesized peptide with nif11-like leader
MSTEAATNFIVQVKENPELKAKLKCLKGGNSEDALAAAVAIAKEHGYDFTQADLVSALGQVAAEQLTSSGSGDNGTKVY